MGLLALVTACGNRDDSTAPTGNGTIVLTLTSPDGVTPSGTITGARANSVVGFDSIIEPINDPDALAFDSQGNLWAANYRNFDVIAYSPAQLATSGNPRPLITISMPAQIAGTNSPIPNVILTGTKDQPIDGPQQLAFDEWVVPATPPLLGSRVPYRASSSSHAGRVRKPLRNQ